MPTIRRLTWAGIHDKNASARTTSIPTFEMESRQPSDIFTSGWQEFGEDSVAPDYIPDGEPRPLARSRTMTLLGGRLKLRSKDDDDDTDWWFASTAIPLIVATFAPMANMLSIAALVVYWRNTVTTPGVAATKYTQSVGKKDPPWALDLNGASLACGFVGNAFLLCNFTRKIRYIVALPASILFFYVASAILIGITVAMNVYEPPGPDEVYSQGYWHAVIAACLYMFCGMLLMVNMLGYFLGHYPQHFDLTDEQRNLILQTMIFFIWLSGGAGIFAYIEPKWDYPDALYFCDVTLLTIGFGDFYADNDVGRGLVFPFSVGGTIILGLMVSSIHKFAGELSKDKVIRKHIETRRVDTLSRVATQQQNPSRITTPVPTHDATDTQARSEKAMDQSDTSEFTPTPLRKTATLTRVATFLLPTKSQRAILMYSERDRFNKMREIQHAAKTFKKWYALAMSVISFSLLWCVGAMVFYFVEHETQQLSYFQALYFCYVSLLTIGYGDLSPKSNAGKPFFILWSLIAVPTMTVLISDLGDTAISSFKRKVLDYGELALLGKGQGWGLDWFLSKKESMVRRLSVVGISLEAAPHAEAGRGSDASNRDPERAPKTIDQLLEEDLSRPEMLKRLAYALRNVASDLRNSHHKRYTYEEWVEFTRLIRFSKFDGTGRDDGGRRLQYDEVVDGIVEWDWLDANSPMISEQSEVEWVMDRLLESLLRTFKRADITEQLARRLSQSRMSEPRLSQTRLSQSNLPPVFDDDSEYDDVDTHSDSADGRASKEGPDASAKHKRKSRRLKPHTRLHGVRFEKHHNTRHNAPPSPESSSGKDSGKASRGSTSSQGSSKADVKS